MQRVSDSGHGIIAGFCMCVQDTFFTSLIDRLPALAASDYQIGFAQCNKKFPIGNKGFCFREMPYAGFKSDKRLCNMPNQLKV